MTVVRAGCAPGLQLAALLPELAAFTTGLAYHARLGNPFSAWGELVPAAVQQAVLACLVVR